MYNANSAPVYGDPTVQYYTLVAAEKLFWCGHICSLLSAFLAIKICM